MTMEYMSSEESDVEDGNHSFKVRCLPWLKKKYVKALKSIDDVAFSKMTTTSRKRRLPRKPGTASFRPTY